MKSTPPPHKKASTVRIINKKQMWPNDSTKGMLLLADILNHFFKRVNSFNETLEQVSKLLERHLGGKKEPL